MCVDNNKDDACDSRKVEFYSLVYWIIYHCHISHLTN